MSRHLTLNVWLQKIFRYSDLVTIWFLVTSILHYNTTTTLFLEYLCIQYHEEIYGGLLNRKHACFYPFNQNLENILIHSYTQVLRVGICVLIIGGWVSSAGVNCHNNITIKTDIQSFMTCKI